LTTMRYTPLWQTPQFPCLCVRTICVDELSVAVRGDRQYCIACFDIGYSAENAQLRRAVRKDLLRTAEDAPRVPASHMGYENAAL